MATAVLLLVSLLVNYNLVSGLVTDYRVVTWNSAGFKLDQVLNLFASTPNLDFVFLQESGNVADGRRRNTGTVMTANLPQFLRVIDFSKNEEPITVIQSFFLFLKFVIADEYNSFSTTPGDFVQVRSILYQNVQLYIYYFPSGTGVSNRISVTTVSRHLATEILYFTSQHNHGDLTHDRAFTNRPIPGLVVGNNIFFNFHAEPTQVNNEVNTQLPVIRNHMRLYRQNFSWMVAGDFNRPPADVVLSAQERIVSPNQYTHRNEVKDYLVYGSYNPADLTRMINAQYQGNVLPALTGSDHNAVSFESRAFRG